MNRPHCGRENVLRDINIQLLTVEIFSLMKVSLVTGSKMSTLTKIVIFEGMLCLFSFHLNCVIRKYLESFHRRLKFILILVQSKPDIAPSPLRAHETATINSLLYSISIYRQSRCTTTDVVNKQ